MKSVLLTLVLVGLSIVVMRVWFVNQRSAEPVIVESGLEQASNAMVDKNLLSKKGKLPVADESLTSNIDPISARVSKKDPAAQDTSAPRLAKTGRIKDQDSAIPDDEQPEGHAISGLVQDEDGYPLANIEVIAEPIHPSKSESSNGDFNLEVTPSASTSFDGSFVFENLSDDEYRIRTAPIDGFATAQTTARVGELTANLVLARLRDFQVWGTVKSTEGKQIEGVRIFSGPPTRATDSGPEGVYALDISIKGKNPQTIIQFRHEGFRDQSVQLSQDDLEDSFDIELNVSMEPLKRLTTLNGSVVGPQGEPVAGTKIKIRSPTLRTTYSTQSDSTGYFSIKDVESGRDYRLSARSRAGYRDYEQARLDIPVDGLQKEIVLEPLNQGGLSGFITAVDGVPVPGIALTLKSSVVAGRSVQVVSDSVGFFSVEQFPEGGAVLKSHSYPIFTTQGFRVSSEPEEPVEVVLDVGPHALFGRVTTVSGETVPGVEVFLGWKLSANGVQNYSDRKTTADQNGIFVFTGLGSGEHTVRLNPPGFNTAVMTVNVGMDSDNIVVELEEKS